ncbi:MAG: CsgG/HfaB family protein [Elusimicrobiota bacterium]
MNFAISEILTYNLIKTKNFVVLEQMELEKILSEQQFSVSGLVEIETAVKVGKLLGVRLLVLGNIVCSGKSYQISARLVDIETREIISLYYTEIDVDVFEKEARPYLVLVPEKQAIGILFGYSASAMDISPVTQTITKTDYFSSFPGSYQFVINTEKTKTSDSLFFGIRYFPWHWLFTDFVYQPSQLSKTVNFDVDFTGSYNNVINHLNFEFIQEPALLTSVNSMFFLPKSIRLFSGFGMIYSSFKINNSAHELYAYSSNNGENWNDYVNFLLWQNKTDRKKFNFYFLTAGIEWKPQQRLGFALSANYFFGKLQESNIFLEGAHYISGNKTEEANIPIILLRPQLIPLTGKFTVSLYF